MIHYLHIGKTGGTALKHALRRASREHPDRLKLHSHGTTLADVPVGDQVFFFVRDPVSRFVSGFYSRWRKGMPRYKVPWTAPEKAAFALFRTPNELALGLDGPRREDAIAAMNGIHHVRERMASWFISPAYFLERASDVLFIGQQEHLADDFHLLRERLKLPGMEDLPAGDVAAHRTPARFNLHLEPRAIEIVREWYATDYETLALCRRIVRERELGGSLAAS